MNQNKIPCIRVSDKNRQRGMDDVEKIVAKPILPTEFQRKVHKKKNCVTKWQMLKKISCEVDNNAESSVTLWRSFYLWTFRWIFLVRFAWLQFFPFTRHQHWHQMFWKSKICLSNTIKTNVQVQQDTQFEYGTRLTNNSEQPLNIFNSENLFPTWYYSSIKHVTTLARRWFLFIK